jgi:hypothetical protein
MPSLPRRLALILLLTAAIALPASLRAQTCDHPGGKRWELKTALTHGASARRGKLVALSDLLALPNPPNAGELDDSAFAATLAPSFSNKLHLNEGDVIEVAGWVHLITFEADGDYHIQMTASRSDGNHNLIVEVPCAAFVKTVRLRARVADVRAFVRSDLLDGREADAAGRVINPARFVRLRGQLFFDANHFRGPPRGTKGMRAATLWEVHPVIAMWLTPPP